MIDIRPFTVANAQIVSSLARQVFEEHVAPDFEPEGIAEMHAFLAPEEIARRARANTTLMAWDGSQAMGILQMRDSGHISILFVETSHMGQGIATAMIDLIETDGRAAGRDKITVNSTLNAQGYYEHLGFVPTAGPQRLHGFSFIPMEKRLMERSEDTLTKGLTKC